MPSHSGVRRKRRYALIGTAVATVGAVIAFVASPASSTPPQPHKALPPLLNTVDNVVSALGSTTTAEQQRVTSYWTPDRMKNAVNKDKMILKEGPGASPGLVDTASAGPQSPTVQRRSATSSPWNTGKIAKTAGKVFFTLNGADFECSGDVVHSANKSTVVTAGHCDNAGPGQFADNWIFVPGYKEGARPFGTWTAHRLVTTADWKQRGATNFDVGFAVLNKLNGKNIEDVVGGQTIAFNQARGGKLYIFGYPTVKGYDGEQLYYCSGTVGSDTVGRTTSQAIACDMPEGSSGGPWLGNFDPATGNGTIVSVTSFGYEEAPDTLYGTYFGEEVEQAFHQAERLSNSE